MILTYKIQHGRDFSEELRKARAVATYALKTKTRSSADVKHIRLKSAISNQILKKYSSNKKLKRVGSVKLTVPSQSIQVNHAAKTIKIPCLKLTFQYHVPFEKANQVEIDEQYIYLSVSIPEKERVDVTNYIGIDRNTTGHIAVVANSVTGKVLKLGKKGLHTHNKYKHIRKDLQKKRQFKKLKQIKDRESRIVRDLNHKISSKIVKTAIANNSGIKLENLTGIRKTSKPSKSFRYSLNSWSFYQLQMFIEYKAKLHGVDVVYINPAYTSQTCSRCGCIGNREGKSFKCPECGHVENADINAAFNIAESPYISQSTKERDLVEGNTDIPKIALVGTQSTIEPHQL
ncbi:transposase [uncultured Methanomethylovorans sp.]|uniref:RNA-guided endonuclease InsQ/TnpB family protein n=1 Tax=uncultured Methanomethylovorans sp. TaxID=183759 RepID=UPI002AA95376|nr:transposase [uncultured Methanomethylovorans sp.]